jgi:DNA-directed RNA polymerase subunit RPC12/RpoP
MPAQVTNYQCPNCTGPLHFAGESGLLECDYCSTQFEVSVIEQLYADKEQAAASAGTEPQWDMSMVGGGWSAEEAANMRGYKCPSCSAEIICDANTAATSCPYCNNPTVVPGQFSGQLKPDCVLPFKLDKNAAIAALKNYYKGKKFLPKSFADTNHIEEIKGIYVPFWLFDGESEAVMRFRATKVRKFRQGDNEVTETEHWRVMRQGNVAFEKVPVDGSSKMPDAHMDAIEPFDYRELKPFSSAYLPGFLADKYDVDAQECSKRANERIIASTEYSFASTITGYVTLEREFSKINVKKGDVRYALMPVWLLSTKWGGADHLFAMNGQTGKLIGDLPVDKGLYWGWFAKIALPIAAVLAAIMFFVM